ncbi:hypothetical protein [Salinibacillus xinjiangensis]|uniref:Uncharacterized protein n=1 Tax=Salinibacillus xinjiangensis TaxID=1229268 RepID=A0A6G1X7P1_9BACI|nr:hypothetical protein [Salinibacillus xinjiangensis]MRG87021.1 hypothetical protein [Salinibacillus xinjiangensis]
MGNKVNYQYISNIMESFHGYEDDDIGVHIADLNSRIEILERAHKITEQKKNTTIYYDFQRIKKQHKDLESEYINYDKNSLDKKFTMISMIDQIQKDISILEETNNE